MKLAFLKLLIAIPVVFGRSFPFSENYKAGVVEYRRFTDGTPEEDAIKNLAEYLKTIESNEASKLDILVFPESTLNRGSSLFLPEKGTNTNPCNDNQYADGPIKKISCATKKAQIYVVINVTEKSKCPDQEMHDNGDERECPDEYVLYNTNIVFDREGTLISKYRKFNLFVDPGIFKPKKPEVVTFDTDFGVKFGHFICFDIVFEEPALKVIRDHHVKDIIHTSMWSSELYSGIATPYQQYWAYSNNVNLLASGASEPERGSSGSGIYSGRLGAIVSMISGSNQTKLLTAMVSKLPGVIPPVFQQSVTGDLIDLKGLRVLHEDMTDYQTFPINLKGKNYKEKVCYKEQLCCDFDIEFSHEEFPEFEEPYMDYQYRVAVFMGNRTFQGRADGNVSFCSVIACRGNDLKDCGLLFENYNVVANLTKFTKINITGNFMVERNDFFMPMAVSYSLTPLPMKQIKYEQRENVIEMSAEGELTQILNFGIFGRHYGGNSGEICRFSLILIAISCILSILTQ